MIEPFSRDCVHCDSPGSHFTYQGWHCDECNDSCRSITYSPNGPGPGKICKKGWTKKAKRLIKKRNKVVDQQMLDSGHNRVDPKTRVGSCESCGKTKDRVLFVFRLRKYLCKNCRKAKDLAM